LEKSHQGPRQRRTLKEDNSLEAKFIGPCGGLNKPSHIRNRKRGDGSIGIEDEGRNAVRGEKRKSNEDKTMQTPRPEESDGTACGESETDKQKKTILRKKTVLSNEGINKR
jgi:hypothetical protein